MLLIELLNDPRPHESDMFIVYHQDMIVYHTTGHVAARRILAGGFRTGQDLGVAERRKAVFFADKTVNPDIYARNKAGEIYNGQRVSLVPANIKGLKLLNMTYTEDGVYVNHKKFQHLVVRGEVDQIPFDVDGTISYLDDGRIYEVCLPVETANRVIVK